MTAEKGRAYYKANLEKLRAKALAWYHQNREKCLAGQKKWREENPEKAKASAKNWTLKNPERHLIIKQEWQKKNRAKLSEMERVRPKNREEVRKKSKAYYEANKEKLLKQQYQRKKERLKADPVFKLVERLRTRLYNALKCFTKSNRTLSLLGCDSKFLSEHLEKQFRPGMTLENYGSVWQVDHVLPCAAFHLKHSEEQEICFNWSNLQPLFASENVVKGDKII